MIELPWADGVLRIPMPSGWRVLGTFRPPCIRPGVDPETLCNQALTNPVGARPLGQHDLLDKRVLLVVDDLSRPTPVDRFFGSVRNALVQAGAKERNIEVLFAPGVHRAMSAQEAAAKIGQENLARHQWHNHDCFDETQTISLGTTSRGTEVRLHRLLTQFDLLVPLGAIEPHLLLGFSGGYKMLLPGCAHARTIGHNHLQGNSDERFNYVGASPEASPMRLDLEEGAALLGKDVFLVNAVLNANGVPGPILCAGLPRLPCRKWPMW
jgi:nickel-dependent lactate racemase